VFIGFKGTINRYWSAGLNKALVMLDVREDIAQGVDPFTRIMEAVRALPIGEKVQIDAPFDPVPLKRFLGGMGFTGSTEQLSDGHWRLLFRREKMMQEALNNESNNSGVAPSADIPLLDVRGLEPPGPLVEIMRKLQAPDVGKFLMVRIHREPIYLQPELREIGWNCDIVTAEPDGKGGEEYLLRLIKEGA